jgi:hypothetical protein
MSDEGQTYKIAYEHFTPENVAVLRQALDIIQEISYEGGAWSGPAVWRDIRVIERAEVAKDALRRLLSGASIFYAIPHMQEPEDATASHVKA